MNSPFGNVPVSLPKGDGRNNNISRSNMDGDNGEVKEEEKVFVVRVSFSAVDVDVDVVELLFNGPDKDVSIVLLWSDELWAGNDEFDDNVVDGLLEVEEILIEEDVVDEEVEVEGANVPEDDAEDGKLLLLSKLLLVVLSISQRARLLEISVLLFIVW